MSARSSLNLLIAAAALSAFASVGRAQLAAHSPFLPPAGSGTATVTEGAAIELRGVMETKQGLSFCIYDPAKKTSTWTRVNEKGYDFLVKSWDAHNETVSVDYAGRSLNLAMRAVKVVSAGQATAPQPLPGPGMPTVPTPAAPGIINPTPADEQRRLDAVAAEVRRRRALREQASIQAAGQPVVEAPAPVVQPAQQTQRAQRTQGTNNNNNNRQRQRN